MRNRFPDLHFEKADQLRYEKEMLGLYVSDHPLMGAEAALSRNGPGSFTSVGDR